MNTEYWWHYIDSRLPPGLSTRTYENDLLHGNSITIEPKYLGLYIQYTGRFIMFSVIANIYNKNTKGPTLMELFTATGKLKKSGFVWGWGGGN